MLPKRKWAIADEAVKKKCVEDILAILDQAEGRKPGMLLAEEIIETVATICGPQAYNTALKDVQKLIETKLQDLDIDIDLLKQA